MQSLDAKKYSSSLNCLTSIARNDGVLALWRGTTPRLSRVVFSGGITFATYEEVMKLLNKFWPDEQ